jgi:2-dehydro-3-deoxyphosphogluconate aldolase/(4S)-4-hydroxy-2-oxoglutarate aldolase
LLAGGVECFEIPLRTARAAEAINRMSKVPGIVPGAGTVLSVEQVKIALDNGAQFIVSPGVDIEVIEYCVRHGIPAFPGVATATDIQACLRRGLTMLKLFPAGQLGGPEYIKAVGTPFPGVSYIAVGGVNGDNLREYLALKNVAACGGSWLAPVELVKVGRFEEITARAAKAVATAGMARA